MLVGNCNPLQSVLQRLRPAGHLCRICVKPRLCPLGEALLCADQAAENNVSSVKAASSKGSHEELSTRVPHWNAACSGLLPAAAAWSLSLLSALGCCPCRPGPEVQKRALWSQQSPTILPAVHLAASLPQALLLLWAVVWLLASVCRQFDNGPTPLSGCVSTCCNHPRLFSW